MMETCNYLTTMSHLLKTEQLSSDMPSETLMIKSGIEIINNDGEHGLEHIYGTLFAVKGNAKATVSVVDISSQAVIWTVDNCYSNNGLCIGDENAVYIARECAEKRYLTAHNPVTGKELWICTLSTDANQFASKLVQTDEYIFHSNTQTIFTIEKKSGKLISLTKLLNEDPESNYEHRYLIPWNDKLIVPRTQIKTSGKEKISTLVLELYNPLVAFGYMGQVVELDGDSQPRGYFLKHNTLFFFTATGTLYKVDLSGKYVLDNISFCTGVNDSVHYVSAFHNRHNELYFIFRSKEYNEDEENNTNIHTFAITYNIQNDEINFSEKITTTYHYAEQFRGYCIYRLNANKIFITLPDQDSVLYSLELPLFGETKNEHYHSIAGDKAMRIVGNTIYVLQRGGEGKENSCKLYEIISR